MLTAAAVAGTIDLTIVIGPKAASLLRGLFFLCLGLNVDAPRGSDLAKLTASLRAPFAGEGCMARCQIVGVRAVRCVPYEVHARCAKLACATAAVAHIL